MLDPRSQKLMIEFISPRFTQSFADRYGIVSRAHTGKHKPNPAKPEQLERQGASHLGLLKRGLRSGELKGDDIENADETQFRN